MLVIFTQSISQNIDTPGQWFVTNSIIPYIIDDFFFRNNMPIVFSRTVSTPASLGGKYTSLSLQRNTPSEENKNSQTYKENVR